MCNIISSDYYTHLRFVELNLTKEEKYNLIVAMNEWYSDTDQDTEEYALEFEVFVRYLIAGFLILNPQMLLLEECLQDILELMSNKNAKVYKEAFEKINQ